MLRSFTKVIAWRLLACGLAAVLTVGATPAAVAANQANTVTKRVVTSAAAKRVRPVATTRKSVRKRAVRAPVRAARTMGQRQGLHDAEDPLALRSSVALVLDQDTDEVLLSKNAQAVLPIASITKLMTALVVAQAQLPLDEMLSISVADVDKEKGSRSRLAVGTALSREEMLHLALMASENRAAHALGRHYPGGSEAFVQAMNQKAAELGMHDTNYVEPTGLSSANRSSARDLAVLVKTAYEIPLIRELSTSPEYRVVVGRRQLRYHNTNRLVTNPNWDIGLQKTGYIAEAGRCLVMQATLAGRQVIMVLLDSAGKYSRLGDAQRVRQWLDRMATVPTAHTPQGGSAAS